MNVKELALLFALLTRVEAAPNILFIMSDDHTTQAVGAYGSRLASLNPTPNIDRLAARGMRFDRVFCNNSICTPSRASIITGQYPQTNGVLDLDGRIPPERQLLPIEMKRAGYQTAMIGKWHLKEEPAAFDYYCVLPGQGAYHNPTFLIRGDRPWPENVIRKDGFHSSDAITDISLDWLKNGRDRSKPFFLMHHFKAPQHDMHMAHNLAVPAHFGIRSDRYKLVFFYGTDEHGSATGRTPAAWEFYDLAQDSQEMRNEYANPDYAPVIRRMKRQLTMEREALHETDAGRPGIQAIIETNP